KLKQFTAGIIIFSMCICEVLIADCNSFVFSQNYKNYTEKYDSIEEALEYVEENDSSFYRTELNYLNTRMDPCLYNYNGIS
ncbi:YfhO family protein, partial [Acinetobacter baumannii]|nr:YfhO family protein [Acinetobacter baumannii]